MKIMALDLGDQRIGVALADDEIKIATPYHVIENKEDARTLAAIDDLIKQNHVEKLIVGLPKTLQGDVGIQAEKVLEFVRILKTRVAVEVIVWDERFTTVEATKRLKVHYKSRRIKKIVDASAAALILQSYLDRMLGVS
jgi:putative Holliday junction resolvase